MRVLASASPQRNKGCGRNKDNTALFKNVTLLTLYNGPVESTPTGFDSKRKKSKDVFRVQRELEVAGLTAPGLSFLTAWKQCFL